VFNPDYERVEGDARVLWMLLPSAGAAQRRGSGLPDLLLEHLGVGGRQQADAGLADVGGGLAVARPLAGEQRNQLLLLVPVGAFDGDEPAVAVANSRSAEDYSSFSPDGKWIVYQSTETGRPEVYVEPVPGPGDRVQLTDGGGTEPLWAANGEIFFRRDDEFFAIATRMGATFESDPPVRLFRAPVVAGNVDVLRTYDVSRDGQRLLAVTIPKTRWPRRLEVVTDWTARLGELAPPRSR
jgi:hypothetical protein